MPLTTALALLPQRGGRLLSTVPHYTVQVRVRVLPPVWPIRDHVLGLLPHPARG